MSKNVAVFVDVANIFYAAKAAGVDIDYVTLLKAGTAGRDLVRAYAYTGLDPDNENQRNFHDFLRRHGYKVVSKDIRKYGDGKVKANLDIELVVDMMKTARNLDIAIVISGDGDFAPAIRAVQEMGVRVEVISFRGNTSSDLIEVADQFTEITQLAKVEKGSSRSGRRVADDEDDLSMTEVPEKQSEGLGDRRRGRGRGRARVAEPVAVAARGRTSRAAGAVAATPGEPALVALPGEKLSRVAAIAPSAVPAGAVDDDEEDVDVAAEGGDESALPMSEDGQRRRRRRRGGRGRGRGRTREDGLPESEAPRAAGSEEVDDAEELEEVEPVGPVGPAPRRSGFSFGSVWDSQIGIPPALSTPSSTPSRVGDEEDFDEPPIPEYLIAERRQRDSRGGGAGRGRAGSYASAIDRERYGSGGVSRYAEPQRGRGPNPNPNRADRPDRPPMRQAGRPADRPAPRPAPRPTSGDEPWSEVPPEIEAMLRAQMGGQAARSGRPDSGPRRDVAPRRVGRSEPTDTGSGLTAESAGSAAEGSSAEAPSTPPMGEPVEAAGPRRRAPRRAGGATASEMVSTTDAEAGLPGEAAAAPTAARRPRATRSTTSRARAISASGSAEAPASATGAAVGDQAAGAAPAAPKRRTTRRASASAAAGGEPVAAGPADEAAPKRRVTRRKAEPTA